MDIKEQFLFYDCCRIVQVDLKFPPKPIVSSYAKDLIIQVSTSITRKSLLSFSAFESEFWYLTLSDQIDAG